VQFVSPQEVVITGQPIQTSDSSSSSIFNLFSSCVEFLARDADAGGGAAIRAYTVNPTTTNVAPVVTLLPLTADMADSPQGISDGVNDALQNIYYAKHNVYLNTTGTVPVNFKCFVQASGAASDGSFAVWSATCSSQWYNSGSSSALYNDPSINVTLYESDAAASAAWFNPPQLNAGSAHITSFHLASNLS